MSAPTVSRVCLVTPQLRSAAVRIVPARQMQRIIDPSRDEASMLSSLCVKQVLDIPHEVNSIHMLMLFLLPAVKTAVSLEKCLQCEGS